MTLPAPDAPRLSKSRFLTGWQCPKLLWWTVHEPEAKELEPDVVFRDLFDQGNLVGARAREEWPDGVLIDGEHRDPTRIPRTRSAIDGGEPAVFEACFFTDGVFCAIDVLERTANGWTLIEVKSSSSVKPYHVPDVAVQVHIARRSGIDVTRAEVMHLNRNYRIHGDEPLFVRSDVTVDIERILPQVPALIEEQLEVLRGPLPEHAVGSHCWLRSDDGCAFHARCWPNDPDHISNLWLVGPVKTIAWMAKGVHTMSAIPPTEKLNDKQRRQMRAQRDNTLIVEPTLGAAMQPAIDAKRLGFLDFETIGRAIPAWIELGPWHQAAAQYSYHERDRATGMTTHAEFLAEGPLDPNDPPDDPREPLARSMLDATAGADRVVVYTAFEKTRIKELAKHLPHLAEPLLALSEKLWDLCPVVTNHVYHPDFRGSFSLKAILTPLVPELTYSDLVIVDGKTASVEIARLLFVSGRIPLAQRSQTRADLLAYCKLDTYATVRLVEELMALARR